MKSSLFTAKTLEEALEEAKNSLNLTEDEILGFKISAMARLEQVLHKKDLTSLIDIKFS